MLGYTINPSWRLQLNAHNLSDHVNYSTSGWNLNLADTPRQVQFAVTVKL
jgi:outer membrane receptor for ferric coprogen and ferric-rhodotorulic acid